MSDSKLTAKSVYEFLETSGLLNTIIKKTPSSANKFQSRCSTLPTIKCNDLETTFAKPPKSIFRSAHRQTLPAKNFKGESRPKPVFNASKLNDSITNGNVSIISSVRKPEADKLKSSLRKNRPISKSLMNLNSVKKSVTFHNDIWENIDEANDDEKTIFKSQSLLDIPQKEHKAETQIQVTETTKYVLTPVKTIKIQALTPLSVRKKLTQPSLNTSDIAFMADELLCLNNESAKKCHQSSSKVNDKINEPTDVKTEESVLEKHHEKIEANNKEIQNCIEIIKNLTNENNKILQDIKNYYKEQLPKSVQHETPKEDLILNNTIIPNNKSTQNCQSVEVNFFENNLAIKEQENSLMVPKDYLTKSETDDSDNESVTDDDSFLNCFGKLKLNDKSLNEYNLMRASLIHLKSPKLLEKNSHPLKSLSVLNSPSEQVSIRLQKQLVKMYERSQDNTSDKENESLSILKNSK